MAETKTINILLWNAMGIRGRLEIFSKLLKERDVEVALVSNTRLKRQLCADVKGYKDHQTKNPILRKTGGTAVFIKECFSDSYEKVQSHSDDNIQSTIVFHKGMKLTIGVVFFGNVSEDSLLNYLGMWGQPFIILVHFKVLSREKKKVKNLVDKINKKRKFECIDVPENNLILITNGNSKLIQLRELPKEKHFPPVIFSLDAQIFVRDYHSEKYGDGTVKKEEKKKLTNYFFKDEINNRPKNNTENEIEIICLSEDENDEIQAPQTDNTRPTGNSNCSNQNIETCDNFQNFNEIINRATKQFTNTLVSELMNKLVSKPSQLPVSTSNNEATIEKPLNKTGNAISKNNNYISVPSTSSDVVTPKIRRVGTKFDSQPRMGFKRPRSNVVGDTSKQNQSDHYTSQYRKLQENCKKRRRILNEFSLEMENSDNELVISESETVLYVSPRRSDSP